MTALLARPQACRGKHNAVTYHMNTFLEHLSRPELQWRWHVPIGKLVCSAPFSAGAARPQEESRAVDKLYVDDLSCLLLVRLLCGMLGHR